jgi:spermidine synthase
LWSPAEINKTGVPHLSDDDRVCDVKPHLVDMPSPFALEPGTVRLVAPAEGFSDEQLDQLRKGTLGRPFIIDYGRTRNLFFTVDAIQSSMRLDDPNALVAPYTRKMMAFLLFIPTPRHVLMIGLGGGSIAKFCYRHLPRTRISVVEINPDVIALREEFAIPDDDRRLQIINDDGAAFLAKGRVRPDIILVDAFDAMGVAPSLLSSGFYKRASQCMTPEGVLVMNLAGDKTRYAAHIEGLRSAFAESIRLVPVDGDDNVLAFACRGRQVVELPDFLSNRAHHLERGLGLQFSRYLGRLRAGEILDTGSTDSKQIASGRPRSALGCNAPSVNSEVRVLSQLRNSSI